MEAALGPFCLAIASGIVSRLGTVIVFICTIKSAHWLLEPTSVPAPIAVIVSNAPNFFLIAALITPSILMFGVGAAGILHEKFRSEAAFRCANLLALLEAKYTLASPAVHFGAATKDHDLDNIATQLSSHFPQLYRAQLNLIKLAVVLATLAAVALLALILDPLVTLIVMAMAGLTVAVLIWNRHGATHSASNQHSEIKARGAEFAKRLASAIKEYAVTPSNFLSLAEIIEQENREMFLKYYATSERTTNLSKLAMDFGQGLLLFILILTVYLRGHTLNSGAVAHVIILIIVLRFALGQIRHFTTNTLALSKDYPRLVKLSRLSNEQSIAHCQPTA